MRAVALSVAILLASCGEGEVDPTVRRGVGGGRARTPAPIPASPPVVPGAPSARASRGFQSPAPASPPTTESEEVAEEQPGAPAPRDYPGELRQALGVPRDCLPDAVLASAGASLRIPVRIVVSAAGRVTRAEVSGALPEEARACVRARAEQVSIALPIEGAPRTISTELVIEVQHTPPEPAPPTPAWRPPPGSTQAPGITLPAVGAEGRPSGTAAPDRTLPAVGAEGRPPGFVPPSSTLPARAD